MRLFLDSSVLLAACGSETGASRAIFDLAREQGWRLLASNYVIREVEGNLRHRFPPAAKNQWRHLRTMLAAAPEIVTFAWPVVFAAAKDRPVLFSAAASADVLLTLDNADFGSLMVTNFYGLEVLKPAAFLRRERAAGRLM